MPRNRMMDYMMMDHARGGRRMSRRGGRGRDRGPNYRGEDYERGRDYGYDYRMDNSQYGSNDGNYPYMQQDYARGRRDYESGRQSDMGYDYADMRRKDGHYPMNEGKTYYPIEAMGTFNGYWGTPEYDFARGGRRDYGYDMRYDYAGDYGETLNKEELEHWCKKMMSELQDREKQMLSKEIILQKAKNMGIEFEGFNEMEYYVNVVKNYTDHKKSIGENVDMAMKLARDDFFDEDGEYKGSEWLAVYYDTFVDAY